LDIKNSEISGKGNLNDLEASRIIYKKVLLLDGVKTDLGNTDNRPFSRAYYLA